jgi:hypothetical protein
MSNDITKKPEQPLDSIADFDPEVESAEGDDNQRSSRWSGPRVKFTNDFECVTNEGDAISGQQRIVIDIHRTEVYWKDGIPVTEIVLGPGQKYRDLDAVNALIPQSEWRINRNTKKLQGPWSRQHVLIFADPTTMAESWWASDTIGATIAITALRDSIERMRRFRGPVYPLVELSDCFMKTAYGGRQRPDLKIKGWLRADGTGVAAIGAEVQSPQLAAPSTPVEPAAPEPSKSPPTPRWSGPPAPTPTMPAARTLDRGTIAGFDYAETQDGRYSISKDGKLVATQASSAAMLQWIARQAIPAPATPAPTPPTVPGREPVSEPSLTEELDDKIKF